MDALFYNVAVRTEDNYNLHYVFIIKDGTPRRYIGGSPVRVCVRVCIPRLLDCDYDKLAHLSEH